MKMQRKTFCGKVKAVDTEKHTVDVVMSDQSVDRYEEVIMATAWAKRLKTYKKHPVLLSSHNYYNLMHQIGKALKIWVEDNELIARLQYFVGEGNEEADWGFKLAEKGIAAFSVGFIPHGRVRKGDDGYDELEKEAGITGKNKGKVWAFYTDVELLENSQVLIPANQNALQKGLIDDDPIVQRMAKDIQDGKFELEDEGDDKRDLVGGDELLRTIDHLQTLVRTIGGDEDPEGEDEPEGDSSTDDDLPENHSQRSPELEAQLILFKELVAEAVPGIVKEVSDQMVSVLDGIAESISDEVLRLTGLKAVKSTVETIVVSVVEELETPTSTVEKLETVKTEGDTTETPTGDNEVDAGLENSEGPVDLYKGILDAVEETNASLSGDEGEETTSE